MVMVVADPILEASRRSSGLNPTYQTCRDQSREGVVHGLDRDGADLPPHGLRHGVGGDVGLAGDGPKHRQSLGGHLNAALPQEISRIGGHGLTSYQILESF
jgi:hypothetical protein